MINVSILLPAYNCEKTIHRALSSLVTQSYQDFEVIVVINNCSDRTEEIVESFTDKLKIKIIHCNIQGIVPALNTGILSCSSKLIARHDADDYWYSTKLEKQLKFLEENPDIDIVGTQIRLVDENYNELKETLIHPTSDRDIKIKLLNGNNSIAHPSVLFKRDIFLRAGIYEDTYKYAEDYYQWLKCIRWYKFANLNEILVDYTVSHNPNYNPQIPLSACNNMRNILNQQNITV